MSSAAEAPVKFDPMSAEFRNNMIAEYEKLQKFDPVHRMPDGRWVLTRHADVTLALTDNKRFRRPVEWYTSKYDNKPALTAWAKENLIAINPPDHTRFRKALTRAFSPKEVVRMQAIVEQTVEDLIEHLPTDEDFDFIERFAYPLPVAIICNMMGIPKEDHHLFVHATGAIIASVELFATEATRAHGEESTIMLRDYLGRQAKMREDNPGDDLISLLVKHEKEDQLTRTEVIHAAISLLMAGHETTTHLLGNGLIALIRNPDQLARLRAHPDLMGTAVDEFLRYDPSIYTTFRATNEEVQIGDKTLPANSFCFVALAAANRDPAVFENPNTLDIGRSNAARHVTFAGGIHLCLGFMLARMEGRVAFSRILQKFGTLELTGTPVPRDGVTFKGCLSIPVKFGKPA
jgi:cytochrome P450